MYSSQVQVRNNVVFPNHINERIYMVSFNPSKPLPNHISRWQETVNNMMEGIDVDLAYLMVDQGVVTPEVSHRRAGIHIDGKWYPDISAHGGGRHGGHRFGIIPGDMTGIENVTEGLLLASDVSACNAYLGDWEGEIGNGGDCTNIDLSGLQKVSLEANKCYAGNVTMLHESIPTIGTFKRTLVRINVPGWHPTI